jgi:hypothetical protein
MAFENKWVSGSKAGGDQKLVFEKGNVKLVLEQAECFPSDPGQGTPAMVYFQTRGGMGREVVSATYWCCTDTGEMEGYPLSRSILEWLDRKADKVNDCVEEWYALAEKKGK